MLHQVLEFETSTESGKLTLITAAHKRLSTSNSSFFKLLKEFKYPAKLLAEVNFDSLILEIWKLATDTPIRAIVQHVQRTKCTASVRDGIISLAEDRKTILEGKISDIKAKILRAKLVVNRS